MRSFHQLIGKILKKVEMVEDYVQMVFVDGTILSIFNRCVYEGDRAFSRGSLVEGKVVSSVEESDDLFVIRFESGESLEIGLGADDYNGPEAMTLKQEGKLIVVWN